MMDIPGPSFGTHDVNDMPPVGDPNRPIAHPGFPSCEETIERLYFYMDGALTDERRAEIQRHLDLCGPCVEAFGFEEELRKVVASRCKDRVPESLMARVASALASESGAKRKSGGEVPRTRAARSDADAG